MPKPILSSQSKFNTFLQKYLFTGSPREFLIILKMTNFWRNNLANFHDVKKIEIYFPYNKLVSNICWQGNSFSRIYTDRIKNIFHNIWRIFRMAKIKHSNSNFYKQVSIRCRWIMHILYKPKNYKYSTLCELTRLGSDEWY